MIVRPNDVERFIERPASGVAAALLYGPNRGLVGDRARRLGRTVVEALDDPFRVAELAPAAVAADPALLADEAAAQSMTGGRRLVRLRGAGNEVAAACGTLLRAAVPEVSLVVVEAAELDKRSRLRALFERAENGAAIACYDDDPGVLHSVIRDRLAAHGVSATPAAREVLAARLGGDRQVTLNELDKLALFAGDSATVDEEDALACVGDGAEATLDDLADAVCAGDQDRAGRALDKLAADGVSAVRMLGGLQRHFQRLHWAAGRMAHGATPSAAVAALRPPVFFKRRRAVTAQLAHWSTADIGRAMAVLLDAEIDCKTTGNPAPVVGARAVMRVTQAGRRRAPT